MKHSALLILLITFSCSQNREDINLYGLWVEIPNKNPYSELDILLYIKKDTIFIYKENGFKYRASYRYENGKLIIPHFYHLFDDTYFHKGTNINIEVRDDSLFLNDGTTLIRSKYESFVEHFANSKGLRINLPSGYTNKYAYWTGNYPLDIFIGYDFNNDIETKVNDELIKSFDFEKRIILLNDTTSIHKLSFRIFADRNAPMEKIYEIHSIMHKLGIKQIHYVTIDLDKNPYTPFTSMFGGYMLNLNWLTVGIIKDDI